MVWKIAIFYLNTLLIYETEPEVLLSMRMVGICTFVQHWPGLVEYATGKLTREMYSRNPIKANLLGKKIFEIFKAHRDIIENVQDILIGATHKRVCQNILA